MKDWQKVAILLGITVCIVYAHIGLTHILDALEWSKITFYPLSFLIYTIAAFAIKGVTES